MFDKGENTYKSDVKLGERYVDEQTGLIGIATSITFYQHACERVCLEAFDETRKEIKEHMFDAPRLVHAASLKKVTTSKTGGPGLSNTRPSRPDYDRR